MRHGITKLGWLLSLLFLARAPQAYGQALQWRELTPQSGVQPEPRRYGSAIYDPRAYRVIIFGGLGISGFLNDLWAFDLSTNTWTPLNPGGPSPAPRFGHNAVYDDAGRQMIVWAGQQGGQFYNDTWTLDLQSMTWRDVSPARRPKARYGSASIFDSTQRRLLQFAGFTEESTRFQDTQAFDVQTSTWIDLAPSGPLPDIRCLHTAAYDRMGRRMIVFGGQRSGPLSDFWSFDIQSRRWTALNTNQGPAARFFSSSFVDVDGSYVLFGGATANGNANDTWIYRFDSGQWSQVQTTTAPSARSGMMGAYIEPEGRFIVFGGSGAGLLNDVWELSRAAVSTTPTRTKTAVVIVNPGAQPAQASFFFTDSEGQDLAPGSVNIPPYGQLARFLHESPFNGPGAFQGTFTIRSDVPISVGALRSSASTGSQFVASSLPVVDLSSPSRDSAVLPLVADGGGWSSQIVLINPTDETLMGSIRFPAENQGPIISGGGFPYSIPPRSVRTLQRIGAGDAPQTGWVNVTHLAGQGAPAVFVLVTLNAETASGTNTTFTAAAPGTAFRIFVENR